MEIIAYEHKHILYEEKHFDPVTSGSASYNILRSMTGQLKRHIFLLAILMLVLFVATCKKQIPTQTITGVKNYLVVNGNINLNDSTVINLSRLISITDSSQSKPELNAIVNIEGQQSGSYTLTTSGSGNYVTASLNLSPTQNYRLHIKTADGKEYASDFVPVKSAPAIDTIGYTADANGVKVNINTHDPAGKTRYYRWDYSETYIIHSLYNSHYKTVNHDTILPRPPEEQIYECWSTDNSTSIILGSSINLSQDQISSQLITSIPSTSEKVHIRYSILVKQYALTSDAYNYFTLLKKNTEQLGSIFDAQPSALTGNIHCISNPKELAIGYVTAGQIAQHRIFIDASDLPTYTPSTPYGSCTLDTMLYFRTYNTQPPTTLAQVHYFLYTGIEDPIDKVDEYPTGGFTAAFPICVDCTLRGTNKKPAFWK
ncbi:MAG TPA: DUF4249 domain-containing protein [Mucilaginibacter sp.]|nr:DUF4249 domain-containing protein [Mucilaginibacter sp.]